MLNRNFGSQSSIMEPLEAVNLENDAGKTDVIDSIDFNSITLDTKYDLPDFSTDHSFLLMDADENLRMSTPEMFCKKLKCVNDAKIKVVSIFGNTGDGKSHTMNHTFFEGHEVFKTSPEQNSCTLGVYAAMQHDKNVLCLDTEGLLGTTTYKNRRMRMLLKILAVSDIVIYRTRSERLHSDMYEFLGTASRAFCMHFAQALQSLAIPGAVKTLGPAVIIFHETQHTKPLDGSVEKSVEEQLREHFERLNYEINAFSSLRYVGIQTENNMPTNYSKIKAAIKMEIENTTVRSPRQPDVVFKAMNALNLKFCGEIVEKSINPFPEQYFTCTVHCESCNQRCQRSMGHVIDGENHMNTHPCNYQHQYENKVYLCKSCYNRGKETVVKINVQSQNENAWYGLAKYAWKGAVIECPCCGEIYRSRRYWYGNKSPEETTVRSEIVHVWKGGNITAKGAMHSAQMVIDKVSYISEAISSLSSQPTKAVSGWLADCMAPSYWRPNSEIIHCFACKRNFEKTGLHKHHCRGCGEGFCHACSKHEIPVPARGWTEPVRVCNDCYETLQKQPNAAPEHTTEAFNHTNSNSNHNNIAGPPSADQTDISVRKYGEVFYNALSTVVTHAIELPKEMIKDTARPSYWVPDAEALKCKICEKTFGTAEQLLNAETKGVTTSLSSSNGNVTNGTTPSVAGDRRRHHCRRCGQAVCEECSQTRLPVPEHGWLDAVRVCNSCVYLRQAAEVNTQDENASTN